MQIFFLPTYLPYLFSDCYRKQTIYFLRPNENLNNGNNNNNNNKN